MNSKISKYLIRIVLILLGLSVVGVTLFLFLYVFWKGKTVMSLSFILDKPAGVPIGTSGGIFPALMGSLYLGALAALIGGILGIGASAYLVFYHGNKYVSGIVNFAITGLSGIPSILFGLVGYTLLIYGFGISRSLLCASLCVSAMIVPFVAIRARKVFEEKGIYVPEFLWRLYKRIIEEKLPALLSSLKLSAVVEERINAMKVEEVEELVLSIMSKELGAIVNLGAVIGLILGLVNVLIFMI